VAPAAALLLLVVTAQLATQVLPALFTLPVVRKVELSWLAVVQVVQVVLAVVLLSVVVPLCLEALVRSTLFPLVPWLQPTLAQ
jgi:hypothetical protein